ncbi:serine hydrolase [Pseudoflavitalea sp. G-6-1-2]|uniref:serine hydrolase domain-containing protein n=1 Tax=Pseudoflavitalea sp. G-6-1-2 TaxID=2728841 RepID=UPI00146E25CA|nr:serine hydrolase [Pseudoflavitalea sp. G-6-1-2]NML23363.1 serine hydrolase [Pseudoflavitalea sp. G-6-1-2]
MKKINRYLSYFAYSIVILLIAFAGYAFISGKTYLFKVVWYNFPGIDDYKHFNNNTLTTGTHQPWAVSTDYNKPTLPADTRRLLTDLQTTALLVIKNDSVLFEEYWDGYSDSSWSGSFSVAKSITGLLVGCALKDSSIKSLQDPVGKYLPEFKEGEKSKVKIIDLLTMSSGTDFQETYSNPLSITTELYYGDDVYKTATGVGMEAEPGKLFEYRSGDTQLLGLIVEKATGKSLSAYCAEKLWHPLGAEHPALWSTDHTGGHIKSYCCFNSNARDFARFGQLMVDSGRWKGQEIISPEYYTQSITPNMIPDRHGKPCDYYGYQWWIIPGNEKIFYARGILGQYIIVIPSKKLVLVRLGKKRADPVPALHAPGEVAELINWGMQL